MLLSKIVLLQSSQLSFKHHKIYISSKCSIIYSKYNKLWLQKKSWQRIFFFINIIINYKYFVFCSNLSTLGLKTYNFCARVQWNTDSLFIHYNTINFAPNEFITINIIIKLYRLPLACPGHWHGPTCLDIIRLNVINKNLYYVFIKLPQVN